MKRKNSESREFGTTMTLTALGNHGHPTGSSGVDCITHLQYDFYYKLKLDYNNIMQIGIFLHVYFTKSSIPSFVVNVMLPLTWYLQHHISRYPSHVPLLLCLFHNLPLLARPAISPICLLISSKIRHCDQQESNALRLWSPEGR